MPHEPVELRQRRERLARELASSSSSRESIKGETSTQHADRKKPLLVAGLCCAAWWITYFQFFSSRQSIDPKQRELALFRGDLFAAVDFAAAQLQEHRRARVDDRKLILLACETLEGSAVTLSRWILQAAASPNGQTRHGPADGLLRRCGERLSPSMSELIRRARGRGVVLRSEAVAALAQCAHQQQLWHTLAKERRASVNTANAFGWTPLHYAAAFGSPLLLHELIDLGADAGAKTRPEGRTPLDVAIAHGAKGAAAVLGGSVAGDHWRASANEQPQQEQRDAEEKEEKEDASWADRYQCRSSRSSRSTIPSCDLPILGSDNLTNIDALRHFVLGGSPALIRGAASLPSRWAEQPASYWSVKEVTARLGHVRLPLEAFPYAASSSSSSSEDQQPSQMATISDLLSPADALNASIFACPPDEGDHHRPPSAFTSLRSSATAAIDTRALLAEWAAPAYLEQTRLLRPESIQFYLGGVGSGTQPHWHAGSWNALLRGRKKWLLWPPERASYAHSHVATSAEAAVAAGGEPLVCEQMAGEVILVPPLWGHATINQAPALGFATELSAADRAFDAVG